MSPFRRVSLLLIVFLNRCWTLTLNISSVLFLQSLRMLFTRSVVDSSNNEFHRHSSPESGRSSLLIGIYFNK